MERKYLNQQKTRSFGDLIVKLIGIQYKLPPKEG